MAYARFPKWRFIFIKTYDDTIHRALNFRVTSNNDFSVILFCYLKNFHLDRCFAPTKNSRQAETYFWLIKSYSALYWVLGPAWSTKNTAVYVTFWRPKLRGQFSETLVLRIYEFLLNFGDGISKEKNYGSSENWKFKKDRNFQLTAYLITLFFLFVISKQVKTEVRKQPLK